ncbi:unnamed protein product [Lactuca virosa]|uniref:Uncharacterized protein n=1 Tax=Lactuca virosa TaxID=75947 RepID=A0AAU9NJ15_9ASTR|nr:unnamed protein product [Lactuca virosa]
MSIIFSRHLPPQSSSFYHLLSPSCWLLENPFFGFEIQVWKQMRFWRTIMVAGMINKPMSLVVNNHLLERTSFQIVAELLSSGCRNQIEYKTFNLGVELQVVPQTKAKEEGDQAMSGYRTAARLFPGCHLPTLYIGMEYMRTHSFKLADQVLIGIKRWNENSIKLYSEAITYYEKGLALSTRSLNVSTTRKQATGCRLNVTDYKKVHHYTIQNGLKHVKKTNQLLVIF